jgi:hypothetical protein
MTWLSDLVRLVRVWLESRDRRSVVREADRAQVLKDLHAAIDAGDWDRVALLSLRLQKLDAAAAVRR